MKKFTEQTVVAGKSSGATSTIHYNLFPQKNFLDQDDIKDNY